MQGTESKSDHMTIVMLEVIMVFDDVLSRYWSHRHTKCKEQTESSMEQKVHGNFQQVYHMMVWHDESRT